MLVPDPHFIYKSDPKNYSKPTLQVVKRGLLSKLKSPKTLISNLFKKKKAVIKDLETILSCLKSIEKLKSNDGVEKRGLRDSADEVIESLLTRIFISLKNSGLINPILKFSLTDDEVRQGVIDLTIDLLKADVIPWHEIFVALNDSGLAVEVIKFLLTDPETREGEIDLVLELIPRLLDEGVIKLEDILKQLPIDEVLKRIPLPDISKIPEIGRILYGGANSTLLPPSLSNDTFNLVEPVIFSSAPSLAANNLSGYIN